MANTRQNTDKDGYVYEQRLDKPRRRKRVYSITTSRSTMVNVRVPQDLYDILTERAQTAGCTRTDLIIAALTLMYLPHDDQPQEGGAGDA